MKRFSFFFLLLALVASLGINLGLGFHVGSKWRNDRGQTAQQAALPGRFPLTGLTDGTCGHGTLTLNEARLVEHLAALSPDLALEAPQRDLIGQAILARATFGCTLSQTRERLHANAPSQPLQSPKRARAFINEILALRESMATAILQETHIQRELINSFTDDQLATLTPKTLPRVVPGLSLREFLGQLKSRRDQVPRRSQHASP